MVKKQKKAVTTSRRAGRKPKPDQRFVYDTYGMPKDMFERFSKAVKEYNQKHIRQVSKSEIIRYLLRYLEKIGIKELLKED